MPNDRPRLFLLPAFAAALLVATFAGAAEPARPGPAAAARAPATPADPDLDIDTPGDGPGDTWRAYDETPQVPEPMVFDLVRRLGARKGELEANVLAVTRLRGRKTQVGWAPEIEYAFARGSAIELEIPIVDLEVQAIKLALQGTLGKAFGGRFIHGWQFIAEPQLRGGAVELTGLYLAGMELSRASSVMGMLGVRTRMDPGEHETELLVNPTFFTELTDSAILGLELNAAFFGDHGASLLIMPQLHLRASEHLQVQLGGGATLDYLGASPTFAMRFITEF